MKEMKELHRKLVELSKRKLGYSSDEVSGHTVDEVGRATCDLRRWGLVHSGKRGHRTVRYFSCPQNAAAWANEGVKAESVRLAPVRVPWDRDAVPVITEKTIFTYGPAPTGRVLRSNTYGQW